MLGLEGMAVLAVSERDGEVEYAIETTAATGWCPVCGAQARLHDRRPTWVRDLPAGDRPVTLVWVKRIWRCTHVECEQQTWTESHRQIRARASWTERARKQACRRVGRDGHSVAAVARDFGVGWAAVMAAVVEYGTGLVERPDRVAAVSAIGVDETAFLRANATRSTVFATGIVDLQRGKLIDIVPGRSRKVLADWLIDQPGGWAAGIQVAALDPFRGYGSALSAGLPHAVRVLDAFHAVRLGFAAVDDVLALDHADAESGQVVFAFLVKVREHGRLAAQKRALGLDAAIADPLDQLDGQLGIVPAHGDIIQEEERLRARAQTVIDRHGDQIDPHRAMPPGGHRQLELAAHAVGRGHQHWVAIGARQQPDLIIQPE